MKRGQAPQGADRVYITRRSNGCASWIGAIGISTAPVFGNSMSDLPSVADAEADALRWAKAQGSTEIIIEDDEG